MITSEAVPFAKTGGLADVVSALSVQLKKDGHDVRVLMPRYYSINKDDLKKHEAPLGIPVSFAQAWAAVYEGNLPDSDVPVYFLDNERLYGRDGVYGEGGGAYIDNCERFTVLSRAAFQLCKALDWYPDIMHAHDWPTAIVPMYLNTWEKDTRFANTSSVLTIHNLGYQGWFPKEDIHFLQIPWEMFHETGLEFYDSINFLKAGIKNADIITTVSPTYAKEIQTEEYGCMLEQILASRKGDLYGILNGIDYKEWSPKTDKFLPYKFSKSNLTGKAKMKELLQERVGLEVNDKVPLVGIVSRLVQQKGFGALCGPSYGKLFNILSDMEVQFVVLGTGDKWCEDELHNLASRLPNLKVITSFNNELAHWIEAGSDFFLMPSEYEPCGLNQMYSLSYGTLPIVRRTGGLADTVENYNQEKGTGTGFVFDDLTPQAIYDVVGWAVWTWYNKPAHIKKMRKAAMEQSFSWENSAAEYVKLYQAAITKKKVYRGVL